MGVSFWQKKACFYTYYVCYTKYIAAMIEQQLSQSEKTHYTNLWCKQQGFNSRDLEDINSKVADYLVLLIVTKQEYWSHMNKHNRAVWNGLNSIISKGYPLKEKHLKQIEQMIEQAKASKLKQLIQVLKIKQLRSVI